MIINNKKFINILCSMILILAAPGNADSASDADSPRDLSNLCEQLRSAISELHWKIEPCRGLDWKVGGHSVRGLPLIYAEFGSIVAINTTLVFTMVHGDEITPLYIGIKLAEWLKEHQGELATSRVVIAPLVNPDSFLKNPRTRVNERGVDVNRNFLTKDWEKSALKAWKVRFKSNPRRFPGARPNSEPETIFQQELIAKFRPQNILSIHAPLNFLDYDGPSVLSLARFPREYVKECLRLRKSLKAVSGGYFPGSLGNFAGQELGIPTLTLELPSADAASAAKYWEKFRVGIKTMIEFKVPDFAARSLAGSDGGSGG